ncbi:hypothetical protein GE09DRAFT_1057305 [Coniochaeta sp. 2T2.1]|nr:hypothetical protein GE09DRAFT_1057305 [Coniochaeta sp. 2T2.1]
MPTIPGLDTFSGNRLVHSAQFTSAGDCSGKKVVVLGTGTSTHDIASKYAAKGAKLTMVQRGSTFATSQKVVEMLTGGNYNANTAGEVATVTERGVVLADGTPLPADDIVFATGYEDMDGYIRRLYGGAVADRLGRVWGLNGEGEMRNNPRTDVLRFFIVAGSVARSRLLSKQVALLIQAEEERLLGGESG